MAEITIRPATPEDTGQILAFVRGLAEYENALHEVVASEADIATALFGDKSRGVEALICLQGTAPVGFALYFFSFSTWTGRHSLFLEDLYVAPEHRGSGAGKALLKALAKEAVARNCARFEWNVLDWNEPAIRFYESLGARPQREWIGYRLSGDALQALASD